jgi:hypothetical protein
MTNVVERCYSCSDDEGAMMILRTAIVGAMVLCNPSLAMAEEVLYCTDAAGVGFKWDDEGKVTSGRFKEDRFTVKVISDTERAIAMMTGDTAGASNTYTCRYTGEDTIVCNASLGHTPWIFYKNNYTRAFLAGPPVGPPNSKDPNIWVAYGTCAHF